MRRADYASLLLVLAATVVSCVEDLENPSDYQGKLSIDPSPRLANHPPTAARRARPSSGSVDAAPQGTGDGPLPSGGASGHDAGGPEPVVQPGLPPTDASAEYMLPEVCGDVPRDLFAAPQKCGTANCHGSENEKPSGLLGAATDLGFRAGDVFERMLSLQLQAGACEGQLVINPKDPQKSLLLTKLSDTPPCGSKMPLGVGLSDQEKECIELWIEAELGATR